MLANDAKKLKELEKENSRLKTIVADLTLDVSMLKELAEGPDVRLSPHPAPTGRLLVLGTACQCTKSFGWERLTVSNHFHAATGRPLIV